MNQINGCIWKLAKIPEENIFVTKKNKITCSKQWKSNKQKP